MEVAIVKYNAGNVYSVVNALHRLAVEPLLTDDAEQLAKADHVIFPGQGEASGAMEYLRARQLDKLIRDLRQPVLGICIGQQLLCRHSEEGDTDCIGVFDIDVKRFQPQRHEDKVPCMGWNALKFKGERLMVSPVRCLLDSEMNPTYISYTPTTSPYVTAQQLLPTTYCHTRQHCIKTTSIPASSIQRKAER